MNTTALLAASALVIGVIATVVMDVWGALRQSLFGVAAFNYGLVGRWLVYLTQGRFRHHPIAASPPVRGERLIGWTAHYLIGIAFAAVLLSIYGLDWMREPTLGPALTVGIGSVAAPFLLMQPGMGMGVAASRAPRPNVARLHSLITHCILGVGFYAGGWAGRMLIDLR